MALENYAGTNNETLLSLLAQHTAEYTMLYTENVDPDRQLLLKNSIEKIQEEISSRKALEENSSGTSDDINSSGEIVA
jgi:hypothetical protein